MLIMYYWCRHWDHVKSKFPLLAQLHKMYLLSKPMQTKIWLTRRVLTKTKTLKWKMGWKELSARPLIGSFWTTSSISRLWDAWTGVQMAMSFWRLQLASMTYMLIQPSLEAATHTLCLDSWSMVWVSLRLCCQDWRPTPHASSSTHICWRRQLILWRCRFLTCLIGWFSLWQRLIKLSSTRLTNRHPLQSLETSTTLQSTTWPG